MDETSSIPISKDEPLTIVLRYEILDKDLQQFKNLMSDIVAAAKKFKGFRGKHFFYAKTQNKTIYHILMQFDNYHDFKQWEESSVRNQFLDKMNQLLGEVPKYQFLTGLESWFALGVNQPIIPPPRYKIALLTWACVFSLLLIIFTLAGNYLNQLPMPLRVFIVSIIMVSTITYLIMPLITRLLKNWLYPTLVQ